MYLSIKHFIISNFCKKSRRLLTPLLWSLPCCLLLMGCNEQPSSTSTTEKSLINPTTSAQSQLQADRGEKQALLDNYSTTGSNEMATSTASQSESLIAAAQPKEQSHSLTDANIDHSNALQATLIGDYFGMFPCVFCDSIDVTLNLFADGTVLKTSIYRNSETPKVPLVEPGVYRQDSDMITIVYDKQNIESYRIQNNHLLMMDKNNQPDDDYMLALK